MRRILLLVFAVFTALSFKSANAQSHTGSIYSFEILPAYLTNGKVNISNGSTTTIKYKVTFARQTATTYPTLTWKTFNMTVRLGTNQGTTIILFGPAQNVTNSGFTDAGSAFVEKEFTATINNSQLISGNKIRLAFETANYPDMYSSYGQEYDFQLSTPPLSSSITINSINKVETILFGTDCGYAHAYGTSYNANGFMETDVWKFAYDITYTKVNSSISDSDIYWEWVVADNSSFFITEKQFLAYPYGTSKVTPLNGNKKVTIEANDYMDEYSSIVTVWARSRSTGQRLSSNFTFYVNAIGH